MKILVIDDDAGRRVVDAIHILHRRGDPGAFQRLPGAGGRRAQHRVDLAVAG